MSKLTDHITNVIGKIIDVHEVNEFDDIFSYSHKISPVDVIEILQEIREMAEEYPPLHDEQPKLSIPKKIAEQADKTDFYLLFREGQEEFYQWFDHEHDQYKEVIYAYLAGKALGVALVEVTDD